MGSRFSDSDFLFQPSAGDQLLAGATSCRLTLCRGPALVDEGESLAECEFELRGSLPLKGDAAGALLLDLVAAFRTPPAKGGESC